MGFRKANELGLSHEEGMLEEEEQLRLCVKDLDLELRNTKQALEKTTMEKEKAEKNIVELNAKLAQLEATKMELRCETRELKMRETQIMADFAELEDENVLLQKQLMQIKQAQVDFESMKYENCRLQETVDELNRDVDALDKLKQIVERNLEEALELLAHEREQKRQLKKELDQRVASDSMRALQALASLGLDNFQSNQNDTNKSYDISYEDHDNPTLKKIEADFITDTKEFQKPEPIPERGLVGDLFSEIHLSEVHKLEQMVEKLEMEKGLLEMALKESNVRVENSKAEVAQQTEKVIDLERKLESIFSDFTSEKQELTLLAGQFPCYESAISELYRKTQELELSKSIALSDTKCKDDVETEAVRRLEAELEDKLEMSNELSKAVNSTCLNLKKLVQDLGHIYCMMCEVNADAPCRMILEQLANRKTESDSDNSTDFTVSLPSKDACTTSCYKLFETITNQMVYLRQAMEKIVESNKQRQANETQEGVVELKDQVVKLRTMLGTKREQIATLRNVLKSNKVTAETAMANLKQRHEIEKLQIAEFNHKLRSEVQTLKEEGATFASVRASFAQQCDEYVTQLDELHQQIVRTEEEKKTLNSLLRMAIQQKMALTSKLEDLENDRERKNFRPPRMAPRGGGGLRGGRSNFSSHQDERFSPQPRYQRRDY